MATTDLTQILIERYGLDGIVTNGTAGGNIGAFRQVGDQFFLDLPNGTSVDITGYFSSNTNRPVSAQGATIGEGISPATLAANAGSNLNQFVAGPQQVNAATADLFSTGPSSAATIAATALTTAEATAAGLVTNVTNGATNIVNGATGVVTGVINDATGAVNGVVNAASSVASTALAGYQSAAAALSSAQNLISSAVKAPANLDAALSPFVNAAQNIGNTLNTSLTSVENTFSAFGQQFSSLLKAKNQATLQARYNQAAGSDWRVRLQLAPGADYLYKDGQPGILAPLATTDGVIFPYMPSIETSYAASYDKYDLVHSNYRGYFYKGSAVNDVNIRATFTAQDTQEANYVLAVIHFFRSATKMFYGQDSIRGAPPPLVFLSGLGDYQFNDHPCLIANFSYSVPNDVDYIRAVAPNNYGNLFSKRDRSGTAGTGFLGTVANRLLNSGLNPQNPSQPNVPTPSIINNNVNNLSAATYVPTKMEINITLLPTNTRSQVSQQFSVKDFANGKLIKGGFW